MPDRHNPNPEEISELARRYPKGAELSPVQRIEAYYAIGGIVPAATQKGTRSTAYRKDPAKAFVEAWEGAGGMDLAESTARLCRQLHEAFTHEQIRISIPVPVSPDRYSSSPGTHDGRLVENTDIMANAIMQQRWGRVIGHHAAPFCYGVTESYG